MISTPDIQNQSITLDKLSPEVIDTLYNTIPIGTVIYSMRTDTPNGFLKADGAEYYSIQYPQFYNMLVNNTLPSLSFTDWDAASTTNNGNVGKFGIDLTNKKFRMLCLTDAFIRNTTNPNNIGIYQADDFKSHTHTYTMPNAAATINLGTSTATSIVKAITGGTATGPAPSSGGTETRPKNVQMNAYVCVYNSSDDISHMSLSGYANIDLSNITTLPISGTGTSSLPDAASVPGYLFTGPDAVVSSWRSTDGSRWYRKYKSGWLEQGGVASNALSLTSEVITFPTPFTNLNYTFLTTIIYNNDMAYGYAIEKSRTLSNLTIVFTLPRSWYACGY